MYFTSGDIHYVSAMPDISQYQFVSTYVDEIPMPVRDFPAPPIYSSGSMLRDVKAIRYAYEAKREGRQASWTEAQLAKKYENLFKG